MKSSLLDHPAEGAQAEARRAGCRFSRELHGLRPAARAPRAGETIIEKHTLTSVRIEQEEQEVGTQADTAASARSVNATQTATDLQPLNAVQSAAAVRPATAAQSATFAQPATVLLPGAVGKRARLFEVLRRRRVLLLLAASLALLAGAGLGLLWGRRLWLRPPPRFQQLSFRRGMVASARFTPDGQTIIYSALWEGRASALFTTRPESPESRAFGLDDALLLSVSRQGEMAVLLRPWVSFSTNGTLARMPLEGGAPREVLQEVLDADWSPDGRELAVIHWVGAACRLEYPIGHVLYEVGPPGYLSHVRVSPRGDRVAFLEHPVERFDDRGAVTLVDLEGHRRTLSRTYPSVNGLDWSPGGDELWFTASTDDMDSTLYAVDLAGRERQLATAAGRLDLFDVSRDGRALVAREEARSGVVAQPPGAGGERELSWLDGSFMRGISADGRTLLFDEEGSGGGQNAEVYLRATDGSPAVRLGSESAAWFPDGQRLLLVGHEGERPARCYVYDLASNRSRPVTPEGIAGHAISPDGKFIAADQDANHGPPALYPVEGGDPVPLRGVEADDSIITFSDDGRSLYVAQLAQPVRVYRVELATGRRELWREVSPADPTGLLQILVPHITPDGRAYAYTYFRVLSDLYLVDGVK